VAGVHVSIAGARTGLDGDTDSSGELTFASALPGRFPLMCSKDGYAKCDRDPELRPGQASNLTIRLSRPVSFEAWVYSPEGRPCAATLGVMLLRDPSRKYRIQIVDVASSEADGHLVVDSLERGIYLLADKACGRRNPDQLREEGSELVAPNVLVDTSSSIPPPVEVRLSKAVTLWIRSPPGDPADLEYEITDARDLPVSAGRFDLPWPQCYRLAAGTYRVRFKDSSGRILEERRVSLSDAPVEVTFGG